MQPPDPITNRPSGKPAGSTGITDIPDGDGVAPGLVTTTPPRPAELSKDGHRTAPDHTNPGWPPGVPYIVGNEACERFSFYGMRAILYVHMVSLLAAQA